MKENVKYDLEERLINFAVKVSDLVETLPNDLTGKSIATQLIRSGLSPALNYGEAKGAESTNDFIHKMRLALKELRETFVSLRVVRRKNYPELLETVGSCITECDELICIFVKSIKTAEANKGKR